MGKTCGRHADEMEDDKCKNDVRENLVCFLDRVFVGRTAGSTALQFAHSVTSVGDITAGTPE